MDQNRFADGRAGIDAELVERLVASQFPQWSGLPVKPVEFDGMDNRTFRLGEEMTVRLPSAGAYEPAIEKEHTWLPILAPHLPVQIPDCLGLGVPGEGYPFHWSVRNWIDGETLERAHLDDPVEFAASVGAFVTALQGVDAAGGPLAGEHCFHRGASPAPYDDGTREALRDLEGRLDTAAATAVWEAALESEWEGPPVWFHGDIAVGNLLVRDGALAAVIDFGTSGVGDPACDLVIAWTRFSGEAREAFRREVGQDEATWARARGWAIWKALILLAGLDPNPENADAHRRVIDAVIAEHRDLRA